MVTRKHLDQLLLSKPVTLFLIDDDEDDRELFQYALEDISFKTNYKTAESAKRALLMLEKKTVAPDFIFLDLNMPEMDGRECLRELKQNPKTKSIPVIIYTTSSEQQDIEETRELGALDFITKPSKVSELTLLINNFLINQLQNKTK